MAKVLVVEDNNTLREGIVAVLKRMGHDVNAAANGKLGLEAWELTKPDLVLTDLKMDKVDGMTVLRTIREKDPEALVMIVTAFGSIERAVEAMKEGAFDFIPKPFPPDLLRTKVTKALEVRDERREAAKLRDENAMLRQDAAAGYDGSSIVGSSEPMRRVFTMIDKIARTDSTSGAARSSGW